METFGDPLFAAVAPSHVREIACLCAWVRLRGRGGACRGRAVEVCPAPTPPHGHAPPGGYRVCVDPRRPETKQLYSSHSDKIQRRVT